MEDDRDHDLEDAGRVIVAGNRLQYVSSDLLLLPLPLPLPTYCSRDGSRLVGKRARLALKMSRCAAGMIDRALPINCPHSSSSSPRDKQKREGEWGGCWLGWGEEEARQGGCLEAIVEKGGEAFLTLWFPVMVIVVDHLAQGHTGTTSSKRGFD